MKAKNLNQNIGSNIVEFTLQIRKKCKEKRSSWCNIL